MEKNRILGTSPVCLLILGLLLCLASCSLPRILVLNDPLTPQEHVNLGVSYEHSGELDAALKEYETASRELPIAYLYMGNVLFQKKDFERARVAYQDAIEKTDDPRAYNNLAWLYYTEGTNLDEAERLAKKAVELAPDEKEFTDTLRMIREKGSRKN